MAANTLDQVVELSHELGRPDHDLAILGEGNTSARFDDETFYVKASGSELRTLRADQIVRVRFDKCNELLRGPALPDEEIQARLGDAVADTGVTLRPSVETVMHAGLLQLPGVHFVGHTHPTAINAIACSQTFGDALARRLFPDHIVVCGPSAALVPYIDPGIPLAASVLDAANAYLQRHGEPPKTMYLQNHGFIALGSSARQVVQITQMAVKAARILLGAHAAGGPVFMTDAHVQRIHGRGDEHYRQRILDGGA